MKFIVVIIHKIKYYSIIWEDEFINENEFVTQNTIIKTLKLLGLEDKDFICDLCYRYDGGNINE